MITKGNAEKPLFFFSPRDGAVGRWASKTFSSLKKVLSVPLTTIPLLLLSLLLVRNLHVLRGGSTSDNFDQLAGNDGLASAVEKNLVLVDHLTGVLGGVL